MPRHSIKITSLCYLTFMLSFRTFSLFQAIAIKSNHSRSVLLEPIEAEDCVNTFQSLHNRTNFSKCELQNYISYSVKNYCPKDIDSFINLLGVISSHHWKQIVVPYQVIIMETEACLNCAIPFKESLRPLRESSEKNTNECDEALLIGLASLDVN